MPTGHVLGLLPTQGGTDGTGTAGSINQRKRESRARLRALTSATGMAICTGEMGAGGSLASMTSAVQTLQRGTAPALGNMPPSTPAPKLLFQGACVHACTRGGMDPALKGNPRRAQRACRLGGSRAQLCSHDLVGHRVQEGAKGRGHLELQACKERQRRKIKEKWRGMASGTEPIKRNPRQLG